MPRDTPARNSHTPVPVGLAVERASPPLVSVIIPAYDVAAFIGDTLRSVFDQRYDQFEVIVVNDGSRDDLETVIAPWRDRLTYIWQDNLGAAAARNAGIAAARGQWLAFLDGDDIWEPEFLNRQVAAAMERGLDLIWSDGIVIGDSVHAGRRMMATTPSAGRVTVASLVRAEVNIFTSSVLVRRELVAALGGFDEGLRRAQDFDLWVRLAQAGARMGWTAEPLYRYRVREGSLTGGALSQVERELGVLQSIDRKVDLDSADRAVLRDRVALLEDQRRLELAKQAIRTGAFEEAASHLREIEVRSLKVRLGALVLRVAPGLLRWYYLRAAMQAER